MHTQMHTHTSLFFLTVFFIYVLSQSFLLRGQTHWLSMNPTSRHNCPLMWTQAGRCSQFVFGLSVNWVVGPKRRNWNHQSNFTWCAEKNTSSSTWRSRVIVYQAAEPLWKWPVINGWSAKGVETVYHFRSSKWNAICIYHCSETAQSTVGQNFLPSLEWLFS